MSMLAATSGLHLRKTPVATCLAMALGFSSVALASTFAGAVPLQAFGEMPRSLYAASASGEQPTPIRQVTTCDDDGPGSLRVEIAAAANGATIDLTQLACSTITLASQIDILQDNLRLLGPGSDQMSIDGDGHVRPFFHSGTGVFRLDGLTVANGYYVSTFAAAGGCIDSFGSLILIDSVVSDCALYGTGAIARGGGVFAETDLALVRSSISGNKVSSANGEARGGAAYASGDLYAKYSSIEGNTAFAPVPPTIRGTILSTGGGVFDANGNVDVRYSTISENRSSTDAGLHIGAAYNHSASILGSTISSNIADYGGSGITTMSPLSIVSSTIAFNVSRSPFPGAGLNGVNVPLTLYSSIVAGNGDSAGESDLAGFGSATVAGANNLIVASPLPLPADTIQACPKLGPLAPNGGYTRTHALGHDSPAIDHGSNTANLAEDQRLAPRLVGAQVDIGSVERQVGELDDRVFAAGFDGRCDQ